jgi:hypothetical protein
MTDQKPPIPFYYEESSGASNADSKKKTTVDHQVFKRIDPNDNNASTKIKLNCIGSNGSVEDLLRTVHQFKNAVPKMAWTTGPTKFDKILHYYFKEICSIDGTILLKYSITLTITSIRA